MFNEKARDIAREKARKMPSKSSIYRFKDKSGIPGSCSIKIPGEMFDYSITRKVAENLLVKHGHNLPFDIMTPALDSKNNDWVIITINDLIDGKINAKTTDFEIWKL